jgi:predicted GH43/DUF377 family glycosyl hydrolase
MFASRGLEVPYPTDVLFIHRWVYRWGLRLERALAAGRLGHVDEARAEFEELLEAGELPAETEDYVRLALAQSAPGGRLRRVAREDVPRLEQLAPSARIGQIVLDVEPAWQAFNPTIAAVEDGFRMIVRTANFRIGEGVLDPDGIVRNINYLVELGPDLGVTGIEPVVDRATGPRHPSWVTGYEDCRLVEVGGRWYATATVAELNPHSRREVGLLTFDGADVTDARPLRRGRDPERHEKNWMPFVRDGELHLVYTCSPTVVLRCDPARAEVETVSEAAAPEELGRLRGGSQGIELDDGWLFVVHEVVPACQSLLYVHRLVTLDRDLRLAAVTPGFTFTTDHIEFCAGLARRGDELVLSFGVSDAAAGLAVVALGDAVALLESVWDPGRPRTESE